MSTTSGYGFVDVSHVTMSSNFGGTCVSDILWLGLLLVMKVYIIMMQMVMVVLISGHQVKHNMESRLAGRRGQLIEVMVFRST